MATPDMTMFAMTAPQMDADQLAEHNRRITEENEAKAARRLAASNRAAGAPRPKPGDVLYVTPARGIRARGRAGIRFEESTRTAVRVVKDMADAKASEVVTTVDGAEQIIGDSSLVVFSSPAPADAEIELRKQLSEYESALSDAQKEIARLRSQAHRNAEESDDGTPSRLRAAAEAVAKAEKSDKSKKDKGGGIEP